MFEVVCAAAVVTVPALHHVFGSAVPPMEHLAVLVTFPVIVWGADEVWRWYRRTRS